MLKAISQEFPVRNRSCLYYLLAICQLMATGACSGQFNRVIIDNSKPRRDTRGGILDAHDGCLKFFAGKYYLYGTQYGNTNGVKKTNKYVVYSSRNLNDWTNEGVILNNVSPKLYFRPSVVYNEKTRKYVLWYNADMKMGVAIADSPEGPFSEVNSDVDMRHGHKHTGDIGETGDLSLFVDNDGTAYITYAYDDIHSFNAGPYDKTWSIRREPIAHHQITVEQLTEDYLSSTGRGAAPVAGNVEAPALFRRGDLYYLLFDNTCGFCSAGTGVRVYTALHPLGPFTYKGNVNRLGPQSRDLPSPWTQVGSGRKDAIVKAQQNYIAVLPTSTGDQYLWMGDRWGSAPDKNKGHDLQFWGLLSFDPDGMIRQMRNRSTWTIEVPVATNLAESP
jgi:hypothetical protein